MQAPLFREEAVASYSSPQFGDIQQDSGFAFLGLAVVLITGLLLTAWLLGNSTYARKHFVTGQVDESGANAIVFPDYGYVEHLNVTEGQHVEAGTHIATARRPVDGRSNALAEETRQQMAYWESVQVATGRALTSELQAIVVRDRQLSVLESLTREGIALQDTKIEQLEQQLTKTASLHEAGYLSNLDWISFRNTFISEQQQLNVLRTALVDHQRARSELRQQRTSLRTNKDTRDAELNSKLSMLREKLIELEQEPYQQLVASRTGTVTRIETSQGASIRPGEPLVYIDSPDAAVTGTLNIPPGAAGHLVNGQHLALELDAFPARTYGRIDAVVTQVSPHSVSKPEQNGYFLARLAIQPNQRIGTILPGMTFRTHIPVEQRTLFSWFLKPLEKLGETLG